MQRTVLTIFGALLVSVQMAAASEHHHHVTKASSVHRNADFRGAYNQANGPININVTPPAIYSTGSDFRRVDPSWIGDRDPSLNPAD